MHPVSMRRITRIIPNEMVIFIYVSCYRTDDSFVLFLLVSNAIGLFVKQHFISKKSSEYDKTMLPFRQGIKGNQREFFFSKFQVSTFSFDLYQRGKNGCCLSLNRRENCIIVQFTNLYRQVFQDLPTAWYIITCI